LKFKKGEKPMFYNLWYKLKNLRSHWRTFRLGSRTYFKRNIYFTGILSAKLIKANGKIIDLGIIAKRLVTTAGVNFLRNDFAGQAEDISTFKYHDCGTGVGAEAVGDTALGTPYGGARVVGSQDYATSKHYKTVGTISFTSSLAITEHGIFSAATVGTLWDRSVFAAINVGNGDSIQFTYDLTINDGG